MHLEWYNCLRCGRRDKKSYIFRYTDVHTDESEGDDYGKGEFCSFWREVTPDRASPLQVVNHVMMTKAQDPLDLPRLDSVQNISSKKKVRQQTHNNF